MSNRLSLILFILIVGFGVLLLKCSNDTSTAHKKGSANSSLIGRKSDTIRVYAEEPSNLKIAELTKIDGNWYFFGDTTSSVENVEIIQLSNSNVISLTFKYKNRTYSFNTSEYKN